MSGAPGWWADLRTELSPTLSHLRVAVYGSAGAPYHHAALVAHWGGTPEAINAAEIQDGGLKAYDVLVMPGGGLLGMEGLLAPLDVSGGQAVRDWVAAGGMYIGSCAGAYLPATVPASFTVQHPAIKPLHLLDIPLANGADAGLGGIDSPGVGVIYSQVTEPGHWLARGLPAHFEVVHYNGPCFTPSVHTDVTAVTRVQGTGAAFTPWERSLPGNAAPLVDLLITNGAANVVTGAFGQGNVVLFGSHPEFGFDVLQLGWGVAARLFGNALQYQGIHPRGAAQHQPDASTAALTLDVDTVVEDLERASQRFTALIARAPDLRGAPAFQGQSASVIWTAALTEASTLSADTAAFLRELNLEHAPSACASWLDSPAAPGQDYGFVGLRQLVTHILSLLDQAEAHLRSPPPTKPVTSPYGDWDQHPYHLLASSYLSAAGVTASASLVAGILGILSGTDLPPPHPMFSPERSHHD